MANDKDRSFSVDDGIRKKNMKVLVMGMGRTGTTALADALKQLGFTPYDYIDRVLHNHHRLWDDAMRAKFHHVGKPWGRREFDQVTGDFDCILDVPCCFFAADLCEAYPEAKVILNTRDADDWLKSMNQTLFKVLRWPSWKILRYTDPKLSGAWYHHNELIWGHFCDNDYDDGGKCKQRFLEHYEHVRQVVPKDRLLEYDIKQGWTPVTTFLKLPELTGTVTRNSAAEFMENHKMIWNFAILISAKNLGKAAAVLCVVMGSLAYGRSRLGRMKFF